MTTKQRDKYLARGAAGRAPGHGRLRSCPRIPARIGKTKASILAESRDVLEAHERLLGLALNEAEALAWQTPYPDLVFPALAAEKVQAIADWNRRQKAIRQSEPSWVLAA